MSKKHNPAFERLCDEARTHITECSVDDVMARLQRGERPGVDFYFVDTREDREFAVARLPGAIHLGKGVIERDIETIIPDVDADIVLYCGGGYRSALAALNLQRMGYTKVTSMDGGFRAWSERAQNDTSLEVDRTPRPVDA